MLDGLGQPIDGGAPPHDVQGLEDWSVERECRPNETHAYYGAYRDGRPCNRWTPHNGLVNASGYSPAPAGKSTLMGQIARNRAADVVVCRLIGERSKLRAFAKPRGTGASQGRCGRCASNTHRSCALRAPSNRHR